MNDALHELLQQPGIWRSTDATPVSHSIPSGFAELDTVLPGGGWQDQALTEILHDDAGLGELRLLMPALARLSRSGRWIAMIAPPYIPYAPALAAQGMDLSHLLLVHPRRGNDTLWALEQALRSGTCAAVLAWPGRLAERQTRRLQLAAETGATWGVLFRPSSAAEESSAAAIRLQLQGLTDSVALHVLKARGGRGGERLRLDLNNPRTRVLPIATNQSPTTPERPQLPLPLEDTDTPRRRGHLRLIRRSDQYRTF